MKKLFLLLLPLLFSSCFFQEALSCKYRPDGQSFDVCFEASDKDATDVETACAGFTGSSFNREGCSADGALARCIGVQVNSNNIDLGGQNYVLYSDRAESYCTSTLGGTYQSN